jgi:hypothetical protein
MTDEYNQQEHKSEDQLGQENREGMASTEKETSLDHPPAGPGAAALGNTTTTAVHAAPADREETKEEVTGEKVPGSFEKKKVDYRITPSPFASNEERELFARDPEAYQKQKLAGGASAEPMSEDDRTILDGPGTRTDALPGTPEHDALHEQRLKAAQDHKKQQEEAEKK